MLTARFTDVLNGQEANYILPFLWQRGEPEAVIREEMRRVQEAGIGAVCVEARPHPDFLGAQWWHDFDIIMDEARRRGMRVWVLDDDHFPTGHAAGKVAGAPPELRRQFLQESHIDAIGPRVGASFMIHAWRTSPVLSFPVAAVAGMELLAVIAAQRDAETGSLSGVFVDITANVVNDVLYWDVPEGYWRVFMLFTSPEGGSERQQDYLNPLIPESSRILLDSVYEAFYQRYRDDFGQTFAGFFSDEPGFYNDRETFDYQSRPGKPGVSLLWRPGLLDLLAAEAGADYRPLLPLLWHDCGELSSRARYTYMNVVSRLYGEHFTQQIGDWCRARGVAYIGHVLEDNGVHTRLGCGAGHYFRALWGQDMAGLDVVLWQLVPGFDTMPYAAPSGELDGEFFHYGLGKMGASLAHLDPKKGGRAMCEVFGAYGWTEGLKLMKWMTDHLLVRGINTFVPHAFSQAEFPDPDCPPHLYARGQNPQYRYYAVLNRYTNRISHLLSGGTHVASAAVLYHAEAEWSGDWMPFQQPVRVLMQHQIDCDVIPADVLLESAHLRDGRLAVNGETFGCIIIPFSAALPARLLDYLAELADRGLPVLFVSALPGRSCEGADCRDTLRRLAGPPNVRVVRLEALADEVRALGLAEISSDSFQPALRYYQVRDADLDVFLFVNEHPYQAVETTLTIPARGRLLAYDALSSRLTALPAVLEGGAARFRLALAAYESVLVITGPGADGLKAESARADFQQEQPVDGVWDIGTATAEQYPAFVLWRAQQRLADLSRPDALPTFSGTFRYETRFMAADAGGRVVLDLGEAFETAEVWLNGQNAGVRIAPPYRFDVSGRLVQGENRLVVEVTNTLSKQQGDLFSRYAQQEPSGLLGPVRLLRDDELLDK